MCFTGPQFLPPSPLS